MLFLIAPVSLATRATRTHWDIHYVNTLAFIFQNQEVTLECAGSVLMPEGSEDPANPFAPLQPTNSKSKRVWSHTHTHTHTHTHKIGDTYVTYIYVTLDTWITSNLAVYSSKLHTLFGIDGILYSDPLPTKLLVVPFLPAKVRRLYDIANVLSTLGLIKKRTFMAPNHRKMPGYAWCGPSMSEIEAIRKYTHHF